MKVKVKGGAILAKVKVKGGDILEKSESKKAEKVMGRAKILESRVLDTLTKLIFICKVATDIFTLNPILIFLVIMPGWKMCLLRISENFIFIR